MVSWVYLWATVCVGCVSNRETLATMCNQLTLKSMTQFTCPAGGGEGGRGGRGQDMRKTWREIVGRYASSRDPESRIIHCLRISQYSGCKQGDLSTTSYSSYTDKSALLTECQDFSFPSLHRYLNKHPSSSILPRSSPSILPPSLFL